MRVIFRRLPGERVKPVWGFGGVLEVTDFGRVVKRNELLVQSKGADGLMRVTFEHKGKTHRLRVDELVANAFVGRLGRSKVVEHVGSKCNNHASMLRVVPSREISADKEAEVHRLRAQRLSRAAIAKLVGLSVHQVEKLTKGTPGAYKGSRGRRKLPPDAIRLLKELRAEGVTIRELARRFEITVRTTRRYLGLAA